MGTPAKTNQRHSYSLPALLKEAQWHTNYTATSIELHLHSDEPDSDSWVVEAIWPPSTEYERCDRTRNWSTYGVTDARNAWYVDGALTICITDGGGGQPGALGAPLSFCTGGRVGLGSATDVGKRRRFGPSQSNAVGSHPPPNRFGLSSEIQLLVRHPGFVSDRRPMSPTEIHLAYRKWSTPAEPGPSAACDRASEVPASGPREHQPEIRDAQ